MKKENPFDHERVLLFHLGSFGATCSELRSRRRRLPSRSARPPCPMPGAATGARSSTSHDRTWFAFPPILNNCRTDRLCTRCSTAYTIMNVFSRLGAECRHLFLAQLPCQALQAGCQRNFLMGDGCFSDA